MPSQARTAFIAAMPVTVDLSPDLFTPFIATDVFTEAAIETAEKTLNDEEYSKSEKWQSSSWRSFVLAA